MGTGEADDVVSGRSHVRQPAASWPSPGSFSWPPTVLTVGSQGSAGSPALRGGLLDPDLNALGRHSKGVDECVGDAFDEPSLQLDIAGTL